jgi:chemotaxis regulatin CheY-phosphate phosphatase CheZ
MAKITVKELKDDALVSVQVNKSFYFMVKSALFYLFKVSDDPSSKKEEILEGLMNKDYKDMTHWEQSFYTLTLLLAEIERQAVENDQFADVEVDVPDDQTKN